MSYFIVFVVFFTTLFAGGSKEGLAYINSLRTHAGLIPFHTNSILTKTAKSHAKYLIRNQKMGHFQKKGKSAYSGKTPSQRATHFGYASSIVMENISINTRNQKHAIDNLFSAIYHRFTFLNLISNQIGMSHSITKKRTKVKSAYVYNLGSSKLSTLCKRNFTLKSGRYYMKDVCKKSNKMIPLSLFDAKKEEIQRKNAKIILYPYQGQKNIWPAFYNESPDPLPRYKVSGFPISVQCNPAYYKKVQLKSFRLYDETTGKEIKKTKILHAKNDPHHLIKKLDFALMPLARLSFSHTYRAVFKAKADGVSIKKSWKFSTTVPKEKLYRIAKNHSTINVRSGSTILVYIVPNNRRDIITSYSTKAGLKAIFMDRNTLKITIPKQRLSSHLKITFSNKKSLTLKINP